MPFLHTCINGAVYRASRLSILRAIRLSRRLKIPYAILADETPTENKHQLCKDLITFQGFYGGCNGQFAALMAVFSGIEFNPVYSDQSDRTNALAVVRKASRRHERRALLHQQLTGKVTPLVLPTLKSPSSMEGELEPVGDEETSPGSDDEEDDTEADDLDNESGKKKFT